MRVVADKLGNAAISCITTVMGSYDTQLSLTVIVRSFVRRITPTGSA